MIDLNFFAGLICCVLAIPTISGYFRIALTDKGVAGHMAMSSVCFAAAYALRTFYWDIVRSPVPEGPWQHWMEMTGGLNVNVIPCALFAYGALRSMRAIYGTIPDEERANWTVFTAWLYPPWRISVWLRFLCRKARAAVNINKEK